MYVCVVYQERNDEEAVRGVQSATVRERCYFVSPVLHCHPRFFHAVQAMDVVCVCVCVCMCDVLCGVDVKCYSRS
jgi:hypothetical protein